MTTANVRPNPLLSMDFRRASGWVQWSPGPCPKTTPMCGQPALEAERAGLVFPTTPLWLERLRQTSQGEADWTATWVFSIRYKHVPTRVAASPWLRQLRLRSSPRFVASLRSVSGYPGDTWGLRDGVYMDSICMDRRDWTGTNTIWQRSRWHPPGDAHSPRGRYKNLLSADVEVVDTYRNTYISVSVDVSPEDMQIIWSRIYGCHPFKGA